MNDLKIEYLPVDSLTPYERNAKEHPQEQIEQIKRSIKDNGMNDPIGIWGKNNTIVEGHGRLIACKELGIDTVPCIRLDHMTDEQRRQYTLIHNQTTMNSGWDVDIVELELADMPDFDAGFYGFDISELNESESDYDDESSAKIIDSISVVIECSDEIEAERIYNELTEEGYKCRVSTL